MIILIPSMAMTAKPFIRNLKSNCHAKVTKVTSTNISQSPRFIRNKESSPFDNLLPIMKADMPARKQNVGAQKCVMNLVKNMGSVDWVGSEGLNKKADAWK
jgi:hypothetical protein